MITIRTSNLSIFVDQQQLRKETELCEEYYFFRRRPRMPFIKIKVYCKNKGLVKQGTFYAKNLRVHREDFPIKFI